MDSGGISELPGCLICYTDFLEIEGPVLLPCTHYLVCFSCYQSGNAGRGTVKCTICPDAVQDLSVDDAIRGLQKNLLQFRHTTQDQEAIAREQDKTKRLLSEYLSGKLPKPQMEIDLDALAFKPLSVPPAGTDWLCQVCGQQNEGELHCVRCSRVDFQMYMLANADEVIPPEDLEDSFRVEMESIQVDAESIKKKNVKPVDMSEYHKSQAPLPRIEQPPKPNPFVPKVDTSAIHSSEHFPANNAVDPESISLKHASEEARGPFTEAIQNLPTSPTPPTKLNPNPNGGGKKPADPKNCWQKCCLLQ